MKPSPLKSLPVACLLAFGACTEAPKQPSETLRWTLPAGASLAYRATGEVAMTVHGQIMPTSSPDEHYFIDVDDQGKARVVDHKGKPTLRGNPALSPTSTHYSFPLPGNPVTREGVTREFTVRDLDRTKGQSSPAVRVTETVRLLQRQGDIVKIAYERHGQSPDGQPLSFTLQESGTGEFDVKAGRYQSVHGESSVNIQSRVGDKPVNMIVNMKSKLVFDPEATRKRTEERKARKSNAKAGADTAAQPQAAPKQPAAPEKAADGK